MSKRKSDGMSKASISAHSFPKALLSENCSLLGTDNVRGQISVHISHKIEAIVFIIVQHT